MANSFYNNSKVDFVDTMDAADLEAIEDGFDAVEASLVGKQSVENGFVDRTASTMSFTDGTRTFSIQPTATDFVYFSGGTKYTSTGATVQITDTEGIWFFYFNDSGTLIATQTFTDAIITTYALAALVYWDSSAAAHLTLAEERHGNVMDSLTHLYQHNTSGTKYGSGLAPGDVTADGDGSLAAHAQISVASGTIWDEDIKISIPADAVPANIPIFYRTGAAGDWNKIAATDYIVTTTGTGRAAYNEWTGATWQLTEVGSNNFVLMHLYATNDINDGYFFFIGQDEYTTQPAAREAAKSELFSLETEGMPLVEYKSVATFIIKTNSSYTNAVKSAIVTTDDGADYVDWRFTDVGAVLNISGATSYWYPVTGGINYDANVGIGEDTPTEKLHIGDGRIRIDKLDGGETLQIRDTGDTANDATPYVTFRDSAGTRLGYIGNALSGNTNTYVQSEADDVCLSPANAVALTAQVGGNVGIGTSAPQDRLHLNTASGNGIQVDNNAVNAGVWIGQQTTGTIGWIEGWHSNIAGGSAGNNDLAIDADGTKNQIFLDTNGSVGIANGSPSSSYKLDVSGSIYATGVIAIDTGKNAHGNLNYNSLQIGNTSQNSGISIASQTGGSSGISFHDAYVTTTARTDFDGGIYYLHTSNQLELWSNKAQRVTIDSNGDVGINATTPSATLDVVGDAIVHPATGNALFTVETQTTSGVDAAIKIAGARTASGSADIAAVELWNNATGEAYEMCRLVGRDPDADPTNAQGEFLALLNDGGTLTPHLRIDAMANSIHLGRNAGLNETEGNDKYNVMVGHNAGYYLTAGVDNVGIGPFALYSNNTNKLTGDYNIAIGQYASTAITSGSANVAVGTNAGNSVTTGTYNTSVGHSAGVGPTDTNSTALGNGATGQGSNTIMLGNASISATNGLYCYDTGISSPSDIRDKADVQPSTLGLDFLSRVEVVDYRSDPRDRYKNGISDGSKADTKIVHGVISQQILKVTEELDIYFAGLNNFHNSDTHLAMNYTQFIMPLINSVKELNTRLEVLEKQYVH